MRKLHQIGAALVLLLAVAAAGIAAPGAADTEKTPQAKALRANWKAIADGDYDGYKKTMTGEAQSKMDAQVKEMKKTNKEVMAFMKVMAPTDIQFKDLKVDGKKATLSMTGKSDGQAMKGSANLVDEGGQWKIADQSWSNAK